jgi:hypothetical protein
MIELPLSIIAWLAVVIVQAVVHFIVFGVRRERLQKEEEALFETLSLSTSESFTDFDATTTTTTSAAEQPIAKNRFENSMAAVAAAAVAASSSSSLLLEMEDDDHEEDEIVLMDDREAVVNVHDPSNSSSFPSVSLLVDDDETDLIVEPSPYYLMQTGKDILRVSSIGLMIYSLTLAPLGGILNDPTHYVLTNPEIIFAFDNVVVSCLVFTELFLRECSGRANTSVATINLSYRFILGTVAHE